MCRISSSTSWMESGSILAMHVSRMSGEGLVTCSDDTTAGVRSSAMDKHHGFRIGHGMRRGYRSAVPLPTRLVSNEEFAPLPQTTAQRAVEHRILADADWLAPRLGLSRRDFLRTSSGMACSLLAMNAVFGRFFDVLPVEAADPAAFAQGTGDPFFIFDVQLHYVSSGYDPTNAEGSRRGAVSKGTLLNLRKGSRRLNPKLASDRGTM